MNRDVIAVDGEPFVLGVGVVEVGEAPETLFDVNVDCDDRVVE